MKGFDPKRSEPGVSRRSFLHRGLAFAVASFFGMRQKPGLLVQPSAPKRIYIAPDDHTDYMWAADEETYRQAFLEMTDYYLNLADSSATERPEYQSRWNCDGSFWMWTYERNRSPEQFNRFVSRLRSGHLSVPLTALVSCYGGMPAEAVLRGMYYAGQIERRYGLRFPIAVAMEDQTLPYGLGVLWAGAGARYSWKGICGCATHVRAPGDREHEVYWWQGPDGSRILMKWYTQLSDGQGIGGYAEAFNPISAVNIADSDPRFLARHPYRVIGLFGRGWDAVKTLTDEFISAAKSQTNAGRQVIVSNELDYFQDFEATYGSSLPSVSASFGNEWELYCASLAEVSARVKQAVELLRGAEALATLASLRNAGFMSGRTQVRDAAWMNLGLYWEHNWTANGAISRAARAAWQRKVAGIIESYVQTLLADAGAAVGRMIRRSGSALRFFAFNPLGWSRSDYADLRYDSAGPVRVIDLSTGQEVPSQLISRNGQRFLRIWADGVPAVGYRVYEIQPGPGGAFPPAANASGDRLENDFYRLILAPRGAITSLIDKAYGNREFVRVSRNNDRAVNDLGAGSGTLRVENSGPVSVTLVATGTSPVSHTTRVTLTRSSRIDIENRIQQNFGDVLTYNFGFNLDTPELWHEEVGAIIRARLLAEGGHYSPRNARYDWLTLNHFSDMSSGAAGITLSNADCLFMRLGNSTPEVLDTMTPQIAVLAGGQVDGPEFGIPDQGGDSLFLQRFALQTHNGYQAAHAMRFALEHQNPLITGPASGTASPESAYPEDSFSLVDVSEPAALLWALKPSDDDPARQMVARLWNVSDNPVEFSLTLRDQSITRAWAATHIETPEGPARLSNGLLAESLAGHQMRSFVLEPGGPTGQPGSTGTRIYLPLLLKRGPQL